MKRDSPLYDVNPVLEGYALSLNVDEADNSIDFSLALEVAEYFGLCKTEGSKILRVISQTVQENWEPVAQQYGLGRGAIEQMRSAFAAANI